MAVRSILVYNQHKEELRRKSQEVRTITPATLELIADLKDTLAASGEGIGLAAPQINVHERVVVVCLDTTSHTEWEAGPPIALINPEITEAGDERSDFDGCLSFPGLYGETVRPHIIRVTGIDERGEVFDWTLRGFNAVLVHHEIDHLNGILFIDRIKHLGDLYTLAINDRGQSVKVPLTHGTLSVSDR